jgi:hypothetical protein
LAGRLTAQYGLTFTRLNSLEWVVGGKRGTQDIVQKEEQPRNPVLLQENEK